MGYEKLANKILDNVGGKENVSGLTHCATRLRFTLKDNSKANEEALKNAEGVLGVAKSGGQFQIIIGNQVPHVYKAINNKLDMFSSGSEEKSDKKLIDRIFDFIPAIFTPILPAIIGAGLIKSVLSLAVLFGMNTESNIYYFINFIGDAPLYFMPIMLGFTTAKKLNVNQFIAVAIAGAMLHPSYTALIQDAFVVNFVRVAGVPVTLASYNASVIPVILMVFALYYVDKLLDKVVPKMLQFFFKPLFSILIVSAITFAVLGPIGFLVGTAVSSFLNMVEGYAGWLVPTIVGFIFPLMVTTGMHYGLVPFMLQSYASIGYETIAGPGNLPSNVAQGAAALCVALKTKNKNIKQLGFSSGFTALLGITEPALFGVTLKIKRALYSVMIGGGIGGFYAGITGVKSYAFSSPGLLSLPAYVGPDGWMNIIHSCISMVIAFVVTFVLLWFWGFEDIPEDNGGVATDVADPKIKGNSQSEVFSPIKGIKVELKDLQDPVFSQEMMGKGVAIEPSVGQARSPINGTVATVFKTKHAIGLRSDEGVEILIHVGLDTVQLGGKYFETFVKEGDKMAVGDLLVKFDINKIKEAGYQTVVPIVVTNTSDFADILSVGNESLAEGDSLLIVKAKQ